MIRAVLVFLGVTALVVAILASAGEAGQASIVWLGWRADLSATSLILILLFIALIAMLVWRLLLWVIEAPARAARRRQEARRKQAIEVLTRGFLATAAGDGPEARRLAAKAADLASDTPGLVRVLAAQAAEVSGDINAAHGAYGAMLGFPEMRLAGHRGLMNLALARGDRAEAVRNAEQAYALGRTSLWAWRALLEARLEEGNWQAGRDLVKGALDRKLISPLVAERGRAALLAASAAQMETSPDLKARAQATDFAVESAKLQPGFAPGVVMAARLLAAGGKGPRAAQMIEAAWKSAPHPALWLAFRDLQTSETPKARAARLANLAALNAGARESRILNVEASLIGGDITAARTAAKALEAEPLTARLAGLFARTAYAASVPDEARMWLARGAGAPSESDWTDLDPEGRAFAYLPSDWARLVVSFAETGELVHPRHERRERGMSELPDLPISYADPAAIEAQAHDPSPYLVGEGLYEDSDAEPPPPRGPQNPAGVPARRRLASGRRESK